MTMPTMLLLFKGPTPKVFRSQWVSRQYRRRDVCNRQRRISKRTTAIFLEFASKLAAKKQRNYAKFRAGATPPNVSGGGAFTIGSSAAVLRNTDRGGQFFDAARSPSRRFGKCYTTHRRFDLSTIESCSETRLAG